MNSSILSGARLLSAIALGLSSVTVISVGLAMFALIEDPKLATLFAVAAVLLDVFKYLAWPTALQLAGSGRRASAGLMITCALVLAGVSAWATYDRMMGSIIGSRTQQQAVQQQRIADLEQARSADLQLTAQLSAEAASIRAQAEAMRARGMVTRALELDSSALPRIAEQRDQIRQRLDASSIELTQLRAAAPKAAGLPLELATLLCIGFALALEVVPALILSAARRQPESQAAGLGKSAPAQRRDRRALRIISRTNTPHTVAVST